MIKEVYLFTNGMISSFDERGRSAQDYSGTKQKVAKAILNDAKKTTLFYLTSTHGNRWMREITRDEFMSLAA